MYWLTSQVLVIRKDTNIEINHVIRKVKAKSRAEAIGKFVDETNSMKFESRVEPIECFQMKFLRTIE